MAQKRRSAGSSARTKAIRWSGLALLALGLFLLVSLLTYDPVVYRTAVERNAVFLRPLAERVLAFAEGGGPSSPGLFSGLYHNAGGGLGLGLAALCLRLLGWITVWSLPVGMLAWGWNRLALNPVRRLAWRTGAGVPLIVTLDTVLAIFPGGVLAGGIGLGLWSMVRGLVGPAGGALILVVAAVGFFVLEAEAWDGRWGQIAPRLMAGLGRSLRWLGRGLVVGLKALGRGMAALVVWLRRRPWEREASVEEPAAAAPSEEPSWPPRIVDPSLEPESEPVSAAPEQARPSSPPAAPVGPVPSGPADRTKPATPATPGPAPAVATNAPAPAAPPSLPADAAQAPAPAPGAAETRADLAIPAAVIRRGSADELARDVEDAVQEARRTARSGKKSPPPLFAKATGRMIVPRTSILDDVPEIGPAVAEDELLANSRILTETLRDFGVSGRVGEVHPGPVITRYEYVPGPGIRVAQIQNRQDDLALKLRATRIRILAPIPGKAAVGIEVPNRNPAPIFLRRLLETRSFRDAPGPLALALGKDIGGGPVTTELSRMPHLLIAGTTGSGKSVCINALITSLLLKRTPDELRMLMVDPKMLELPMYNGIPHLLTEVVTDPKLAARSLKWLLLEMERRYRVLSARGCRNIQSYNGKVEKEGPGAEGEEKLPYIVVIVDELADLMIVSGKDVEEPIARLAQTARAVGIHLIIATQRPSVDVITGVIKANFPARIAFQVASRTDSRTILDQNGAESLLGKGDMLFLPPGQAAPLRVHGAFVSESETQRLADAWRDQGEPEGHSELEAALTEPESAMGGVGDDALFEDAARLVVAAGQASASMLQRRLKVGYARAARLVDMLESAGVVSVQDGSKPREILVDEVRLEHVLAGQDE